MKNGEDVAMRRVQMCLLGAFALIGPDGKYITPKAQKAQALLALVATSEHGVRSRVWLCDKLWSDREAEQASSSLRQALTHIRKCLGPHADVIETDRTSVRIRLDLIELDLLALTEGRSSQLEGAALLRDSIDADFLEGIDIRDPEFEDWLTTERNYWWQARQHLLQTNKAKPQIDVAESPSDTARVEAVMESSPLNGRKEASGLFLVSGNGAEYGETNGLSEAAFHSMPVSSIAVMQLENLSGEPPHICHGVTGDIISNLTRFHDLHVIAQRSSLVFHGMNLSPREIGARLGVRYLVDGGYQRIANKVRIQFQLIDAMSERSIWSDRYDGDMNDIFAFQDEVTNVVASRLSIEVSASEMHRMALSAPSDLQAYGLILHGKYVYQRLLRETNQHARRLFEQAAEVDPNYARSYVGISRTLNDAWRFNWVDPPEPSLDEAVRQAEIAIRLDPGDARGYAALGSAYLYKRDHEASLAAYERALGANPNDADVLAEMGHSVSVYGDTERAVSLIKRAMRLNPYYPDWYLWHLGEAYFDMQDYEQAIRTLNQMHDKTEAYRMLTASNALLGRLSEARQYARQLLLTHPEFTLAHWTNVPPDRNPEPRERLIDGLREAGIK
ncbi:tetratricopeptide repeat protein [Aminobacter sp. AP02]|uniref:tetratricopeptide repeat protein n=1 Tax=Aminobacter sp. AP02 TaxID=2135737 RepID=UPI000D6D1FB7|nr:tetratricopeptide repeat protein [Aminobacter sp. AP02]PWK73863.1 TolB-like protein [Aminobacter sp. AP02]